MGLTPLNDPSWVVKSSGRILGPYSLDQLVAELKEKRISIIDEVRTQEKRWGFIREFPQFSEVVQFLRDQQSRTKEDTGSISLNTKTITETGLNDDLTPTPVLLESDYQPHYQKVEAQEKVVRPSVADRTYASSTDPLIQRSITAQRKKQASYAWIGLALIVLALAYTFMGMKQDTPKSLGYDDYLKLAKYNRSIGIYDKALEFFKKADAIKALDSTSKLQMAPLLMVVENQNMNARQTLERIKASTSPDPGALNDIDLFIAISLMREGDLDKAEAGFIEILNRDRTNANVQINRNVLRMLKGEYLGAYYEIGTLLEKGVKDQVLLVLRALAAYQAFDVADNRERLESSIQDLYRYTKKNRDYFPESMLLVAALQKKLGMNIEMLETLKGLLNGSPTVTQEHIHSMQVDRQVLGWDFLFKICQDVQKGLEQSSLVMGMMSYCHYQRNEMGPAIDIYQRLRNQYSKETSLYAFHAFLLFQLGRVDEANAVLRLPGAMDSILSLEVAAQNCMNNRNWNCAEQRWNEILTRDSMDLKAITGLAAIASEKGQKELASDMLRRGLSLSERYRPLIEVKDQIDAL